jgi:hypothetical protein
LRPLNYEVVPARRVFRYAGIDVRGGKPGSPLWPTKSFSPEVEALKSRTTRDDHISGKRGEPR